MPHPRPASSRRHSPRDRRRRGTGSEERWILLLGIVATIAIVAGSIDPLRRPLPSPAPPRHPRLTMAQARASNAAVAIRQDRLVRAPRFTFHGGPAAREQATQCLATAALYEGGDDPLEQKAIIQVVLNRVRSPAFPKTICGVVYQGADRATGCQFSFSCDGSVVRRPEHQGWDDARRIARRALDGTVFAPVGRATHYHADWMVPYWRDSLVKVAKVRGHLFYTAATAAR